MLFDNNEPCVKKGGSNFDVGEGSYDRAEECELVGLLILSHMKHLNLNFGLYRDDGCGSNTLTPRQRENMKKDICKIFQSFGLQITIETNIKVVNFLDVTLDLNTHTHRPYNKPNNTPLYINVKSNHPPCVLKNIPLAVQKLISKNSANKAIFDAAITPYLETLKNS